jgi:DNA-binding transcriptional LysR family regulator
MRHLDLALLQTFVAIADNGSFTQAARQVHRTQSAVSLQMQRLEAAAGCSRRTAARWKRRMRATCC